MIPFLVIHAKGGENMSPKQKDRTTTLNMFFNWLKISKNFKIRWWCGPFALGSYFLPLWYESPKTESLEPNEVLSPPLVIK